MVLTPNATGSGDVRDHLIAANRSLARLFSLAPSGDGAVTTQRVCAIIFKCRSIASLSV
jgi:hypothetical protein